jgi:hypothetical protein
MSILEADRAASIPERLYAVLLRLCPSEFRHEYGYALHQILRDRLRDEKPASAGERAMFWASAFSDLIRTVALERLEQMVTTTNLVRYSGPLAIVGGALWAGGMTFMAIAMDGLDSVVPILLIAAVAFASCLIAIAVQGGYATPKLGFTGALFGGLASIIFLGGLFTAAWWLFALGLYALIVGSALTGLGMLSLQQVSRRSSGALIVASAMLVMMNDTNLQAWLAVPFGFAWIAVGYVLSTRSNDSMMLAP